jgi:hypothetical protein
VRAARRATTTEQYFLKVSIRLKTNSLGKFSEQAQKVLPVATKDTGLRLVAAGYRMDPDPRTLVHFWTLDSADQLRSAMISLSDVPAYSVLDSMVLSEQQEICTPLVPPPEERPRARFYVLVTGMMPTTDLAEFVAQIEANTGPFSSKSHWKLCGALVNVTGTVNGVSLVWAVDTEEAANQFVTEAPGYNMITDPASEIWTPTIYDPYY